MDQLHTCPWRFRVHMKVPAPPDIKEVKRLRSPPFIFYWLWRSGISSGKAVQGGLGLQRKECFLSHPYCFWTPPSWGHLWESEGVWTLKLKKYTSENMKDVSAGFFSVVDSAEPRLEGPDDVCLLPSDLNPTFTNTFRHMWLCLNLRGSTCVNALPNRPPTVVVCCYWKGLSRRILLIFTLIGHWLYYVFSLSAFDKSNFLKGLFEDYIETKPSGTIAVCICSN